MKTVFPTKKTARVVVRITLTGDRVAEDDEMEGRPIVRVHPPYCNGKW